MRQVYAASQALVAFVLDDNEHGAVRANGLTFYCRRSQHRTGLRTTLVVVTSFNREVLGGQSNVVFAGSTLAWLQALRT